MVKKSDDYQHKLIEIPTPQEVMEQLIVSNRVLGPETEEEAEYREKKEIYNKKILEKIGKIRLTDKQQQVLDMIFKGNMTLEEIGSKLGITFGCARKLRDRAFNKIRKAIKYKGFSL